MPHPAECLPGLPAQGGTLPYRLPWRRPWDLEPLLTSSRAGGISSSTCRAVSSPPPPPPAPCSRAVCPVCLGAGRELCAPVSPGSVHMKSRAVAPREAGTPGGSLVCVRLPSQSPQAAYQGAPGTVGRARDSTLHGSASETGSEGWRDQTPSQPLGTLSASQALPWHCLHLPPGQVFAPL